MSLNQQSLTGIEEWREYVYADGFTYRVDTPAALFVKNKPEGDSHRVVDASGVTHYIPSGWRILRWRGATVC